MNSIEKLIDQLVMKPYGIDFNIEQTKMNDYTITINIDDSKLFYTSDNYDENYAQSIFNIDLEDKIYKSLKYISIPDNNVKIIYNHYNKTYMNQLEKEIESIVNDYTLRSSQKDRTKYEFDVFIDASNKAPHLFLTINTNLPDNRQKELWRKLLDEHQYDDLVIEFDEYI